MEHLLTHKPDPLNSRSALLISLFLIFIIAALFWRVQYFGFIHYDDFLYVTENTHVQGGLGYEGFMWAMTTSHASNWHPLTWLSLMADYELFWLNPAGYHWTNLLFHIANTVLLLLVLNGMTGALWRSVFVAALFAIHPLHVESVAWIAERKDVLSAFFWMLTMGAYVRYVRHPGLSRYLALLLAFILGLMAKPMLASLPFVLLLLDYWPLRRFRFGELSGLSRLIVEKVPLFIFSGVSALVTFLVQKNAEAVASLEFLSIGTRLTNAFVSYATYVVKTFWPTGLAIFYPHPGTWSVWQVVWSVLLVVGVTVCVVACIRRYPYGVVGWLWYLGTLVPVIGLVQVGSQAMADRYTYVPLIGLFIVVVWGVADLLRGWRYGRCVGGVAAAAVLSALVVVTWFQVQRWRDSITIFTHALKVTQNNYFVNNNLGVALFQDGRIADAIFHFQEAARIKSDHADAYTNMGFAMAFHGKHEEALPYYFRALQLKQNDERLHNNLANSLSNLGRLDEAIHHFREVLKIRPDYAEAHNNIGVAFARQNRLDEAIPHFRKTLRIKPDNADAENNMGSALARQGKFSEAARCFERALQLDSRSAMSHNNLGAAFMRMGRLEEAAGHFMAALGIKPDYVDALNNLHIVQEMARGEKGDGDQ
jgi:protein O-mannosyl-transferase